MKKLIFISFATIVFFSVSVFSQAKNDGIVVISKTEDIQKSLPPVKKTATFVAPTLSSNQEQIDTTTICIDLKKEQEEKVVIVTQKKEILTSIATKKMLSEVETALSETDKEKGFEKRHEAWLKYAKTKKEIEETYVQDILDVK